MLIEFKSPMMKNLPVEIVHHAAHVEDDDKPKNTVVSFKVVNTIYQYLNTPLESAFEQFEARLKVLVELSNPPLPVVCIGVITTFDDSFTVDWKAIETNSIITQFVQREQDSRVARITFNNGHTFFGVYDITTGTLNRHLHSNPIKAQEHFHKGVSRLINYDPSLEEVMATVFVEGQAVFQTLGLPQRLFLTGKASKDSDETWKDELAKNEKA